MKFFEDQEDFYYQADNAICRCSECNEEFVILEDEDPSECPLCGAHFYEEKED